jgi:hypothetical protein
MLTKGSGVSCGYAVLLPFLGMVAPVNGHLKKAGFCSAAVTLKKISPL